jgi:hypothetical protein
MRSAREGPVLKEKIVAIMGPPLHHSHSEYSRGSTRFRAVRRKGGGRGEEAGFEHARRIKAKKKTQASGR